MNDHHERRITRGDGTEVSSEQLESVREAARAEVERIMSDEGHGGQAPPQG